LASKDNCSVLPRPEMFDFHRVCMVHQFTDNWENLQNFKARPDDILIYISVSLLWTTWVSYILDLLHFGHMGPDRQKSIPLNDRVPFLEICKPCLPTGTEQAEKLPTTPRLIKTHLPVQFVPQSFWEQRCRIIYVARNAKDNVVSYFHFARMNSSLPEPGDWSAYLQEFMEGKRAFGSRYDHVNNLIEDCGREIDRLCSFLGLSPSVEEKERVRASVTFDSMKQNKMTNYSTVKTMNHKVSPFMRKGKVGDWKNHFTVAQIEKFDEDYKQKMKNPDLKFRFEI
uniref:Sulfotransferase n=1 Tax=Neolamprologus brichardi TaxID=32507 RepID=A0A3Q4HNI9_NEOBR